MSNGPGMDQETGFTLIELLITIAIVGVAIVPIVIAYMSTWQATIEAKRRNQAVMLVRQKISSLEGTTPYNNISGTLTNSFNEPYKQFNYKIDVVNLGGASNSTYEAKILKARVTFPSSYGPRRSVNCQELSECNLDENWDLSRIITPMEGSP